MSLAWAVAQRTDQRINQAFRPISREQPFFSKLTVITYNTILLCTLNVLIPLTSENVLLPPSAFISLLYISVPFDESNSAETSRLRRAVRSTTQSSSISNDRSDRLFSPEFLMLKKKEIRNEDRGDVGQLILEKFHIFLIQ